MHSSQSSASGPLSGRIRVPGDKSISHRAVMLGALAVGETRIDGLLEGEDVLATAAAFRAMGARIERAPDGTTDGGRASGRWYVTGVGLGGLAEPDDVLDMGNSGTAARLLLGILAGHPIRSFLTGDASLRKRPMNRVADPLRTMGARIEARSGGRLPLMIQGAEDVLPVAYELPVPSAQIKSAVLLAGLNARGETSVIENAPTRDHTERMLTHFGGIVRVEEIRPGCRHIAVTGQPELTASDIIVPGDPSSAAFPLVAALIVPGSEITVEGVGTNATRTGLFEVLKEMGADLTFENERIEGGEPLADITARYSPLKGVEVPPEIAPRMIDEYPILAVAAAQADGRTIMHGLEELRVKECDRLSVTAEGLKANGILVEEGPASLAVDGRPGDIPGGGRVETHIDHRIAMSFLTLGLSTRRPVTVDDASPIATSFPDFTGLMREIGATMSEEEHI